MTRYSVSGTLSPDATTADTGEPAGQFGGHPYWSWGEWYLFNAGVFGSSVWVVANRLSVSLVAGGVDRAWQAAVGGPAGEYNPMVGMGTAGTATVAEYVAPPTPTEYAVLTINDGPLAGEYIVLKKR